MLFLYTVGKMEPKSAGGLLEASPSSILHRSNTISSDPEGYGFRGAPRKTARDSLTSQRLPFSSRITRVWLFVRALVSKYVSMMRGGGRLSVASHVRQIRSGSRRTSVSSNSTLNYNPKGNMSVAGDNELMADGMYPTINSRGLGTLIK